MPTTSQPTAKLATPLFTRRTPPRAADPTRRAPNRLARNDARNERFGQRNRPPLRAEGEFEHVRTANARGTDEAHRRRYIHEKFRPEQIAWALRKTKGGIAAASKVLGCARNTVLRYLDAYPELRETAQDEVELALDLAEQSLFVDAASGDPDARRFLLLTRGRDRGYILRRETTGATGHGLPSSRDNSVIVIDGDKQQYLDGLRRMREAALGVQSAPPDAMAVATPAGGNAHNGNGPG
jgi:hypothetical protein